MQNIPQELRDRDQWLHWFLQNGTKVPIGRSNDSSTWLPFDSLHGDRIAYVISPDDPYVGIDLDDCYNGQFSPWAREILDRFRGVAYAEFSPSGTGVKLLTRGVKPNNTACKVGSVECYDSMRFWTVTGKIVSHEQFAEIGEGQESIEWLCQKYLKKEQQAARHTVPIVGNSTVWRRASDYISSCAKACEGGRNNAAFSIAGHLYSIVGDSGEKLGESDVFGLVSAWNSSLPSPLDESEVERACKSAAVNGTARQAKMPNEVEKPEVLLIDWESLNSERADDFDDESFATSMVPESGLLRKIFDFYGEAAYRPSSVMGLAVAVSLIQTILGRKVRSHTDLRTNDYNLILAATGSGKEACETTITKILASADQSGTVMLPPDMQSGNGLMRAVSCSPAGIWVCDEFGKILQAVLDKKGNHHLKNIGHHLLKLYGKSGGSYGGAGHADGTRHKVNQPHLCLLGLATPSSVFEAVEAEQVSDGLIGRISFWSVQERPEAKEDMGIATVPDDLSHDVRGWIEFEPPGGNLEPDPVTMKMSSEAIKRWKSHARAIDIRMREESELRSAIWSRVAARSMKLSLVHRCARLGMLPSQCAWEFMLVEEEDIDWAIRLSNWLAGTACSLIRENVADKTDAKARAILTSAIQQCPEGINRRDILRQYRSMTAGDIAAAAKGLGLREEKRGSGSRPSIWYVR